MLRVKIRGLNYYVELVCIFSKQIVRGLLEAPEALTFLALSYVSSHFSKHLSLKFQNSFIKNIF